MPAAPLAVAGASQGCRSRGRIPPGWAGHWRPQPRRCPPPRRRQSRQPVMGAHLRDGPVVGVRRREDVHHLRGAAAPARRRLQHDACLLEPGQAGAHLRGQRAVKGLGQTHYTLPLNPTRTRLASLKPTKRAPHVVTAPPHPAGQRLARLNPYRNPNPCRKARQNALILVACPQRASVPQT